MAYPIMGALRHAYGSPWEARRPARPGPAAARVRGASRRARGRLVERKLTWWHTCFNLVRPTCCKIIENKPLVSARPCPMTRARAQVYKRVDVARRVEEYQLCGEFEAEPDGGQLTPLFRARQAAAGPWWR